ncbi:unnamed protein product [Durusdinium trenchii]|uniref:Uncharacterized protein n=1 Tax=Durusdinium trenchii TaxID=1381693 RepID=A0ABP0QS79_9DINO
MELNKLQAIATDCSDCCILTNYAGLCSCGILWPSKRLPTRTTKLDTKPAISGVRVAMPSRRTPGARDLAAVQLAFHFVTMSMMEGAGSTVSAQRALTAPSATALRHLQLAPALSTSMPAGLSGRDA